MTGIRFKEIFILLIDEIATHKEWNCSLKQEETVFYVVPYLRYQKKGIFFFFKEKITDIGFTLVGSLEDTFKP